MYLKGFAAAQFYNPSLAGEHLDKALGRPLNELVPLYNSRNTNTASAAVLRDNLPTLPADDACAIIYATIQVNFPKSPVMHFPLYAEDYAFWAAENRATWPDQWSEELTPAMSHEVSIIQNSLSELEKHRADLCYTVEQMDTAVQEAVKAVFRFKAAHQALKLPHSMWDDDSNDEDGPQVPRRVWAPQKIPDRGSEPIPLVTESDYYDERLFGGLKKQRTTYE